MRKKKPYLEIIKENNFCCVCKKPACRFFQTKCYCSKCWDEERKGGK